MENLNRKRASLVRIPATCRFAWITDSMEGPVDPSNDVGRTPGDALVSDVVCRGILSPRTKGDRQIERTLEAGQKVHSPIVEPRQTIRGGRQFEIRYVRQLIVPPRGVNRSIRG